jgi:5-methyltetrahydropteroyltriglutamate--homocysteine methyltransferase
MPRIRPPFRADQVGSLLRPASVKAARERWASGALDDQGLREVEDEAIADAVARQEAIGLQSITDGEMRRAAWTTDFLKGLDGVSVVVADAVTFKGATPHKTKLMTVTGKLGWSGHPMLEHFGFLKSHTNATAKMTIPSPMMLTSPTRNWREVVDQDVYPTLEALYEDLGKAYREAIKAFADAGCRYLQIDDCSFAFFCDPAVRQKIADRGDDPDALLDAWVGLINSALKDKPAGLTVSTHMCRGNFRSTWLAQGGYEPVAELLFNRLPFDAYFMEYDSDRAGGFEPLRRMPAASDKIVVLGLVTTKSGVLEDRDEIKRRIDQAASYIPLERLCLSPQCGFASTEEGNVLAEEEQWAKLASIVEIADEVWGNA